jgi:glycosyltransferase involved in cell wall biosynthesis
MGYHILPGACTALIAARLLGRPACYQMTGGPIEIMGGGIHNESWLMRCLARPSAFLERLAVTVVRQFDLIVVRGDKARSFLAERDICGTVAVITGSIDNSPSPPIAERPIDMVFVGRLTEIKQPYQFVEIAAAISGLVPSARSTVLGDGPLLEPTRKRAAELRVADRIDFVGRTADVSAFLRKSKIFVLTSRSEGLSIAMAEAMAAGCVPVVADVGELRDLVTNGINGFLVAPNDINQYVERIASLLSAPGLWSQCSAAARRAATHACSREVISQRWHSHLEETINRASGAILA